MQCVEVFVQRHAKAPKESVLLRFLLNIGTRQRPGDTPSYSRQLLRLNQWLKKCYILDEIATMVPGAIPNRSEGGGPGSGLTACLP